MAFASLFVDKNESIKALFREFKETFLTSPRGHRRAHQYKLVRDQARLNYAKIENALSLGQNVTELVIWSVLPHMDSVSNRQKGAWLHVRADVSSSGDKLFEKTWYINKKDHPDLAQALIRFVRHCIAEPARYPVFADEFLAEKVSQGFCAALLSPILSALRPDAFHAANKYTARLAASFTGSSEEMDLFSYSKLNRAIGKAIDELLPKEKLVEGLHRGDLFDLFAYWLYEVKKDTSMAAPSVPVVAKEEEIEPPVVAVGPSIVKEEKAAPANDEYVTLAEESGFLPSYFKRFERILKRKGQLILAGPPGTGKSFIAKAFIKVAAQKFGGSHSTFTVHGGASSEDLAESLCLFLMTSPKARRSFFLIDGCEGDSLGQLLGPLAKGLFHRDEPVELSGGREITIPSSMGLIVTMSSAGDCLGKMKSSLASKFATVPLGFRSSVIRAFHKGDKTVEPLIALIENINSGLPSWRNTIGHGPFLCQDLQRHLEDIWTFEVEPYLESFLSDDELKDLRWSAVCTLLQQ